MNRQELQSNTGTNRFAYLVCAFMRDHISEEEQIELNNWLDDDERSYALFAILTSDGSVFDA